MRERTCDFCGKSYDAERPNSRFCGPTCRQRFKRNPNAATVTPLPTVQAGEPGPVYAATRSELEAAGRESTSLGASALALAARIDSGQDTGSPLAALVKELRATLAEAVRGAQVAASPLDELRRRRDAKRASG